MHVTHVLTYINQMQSSPVHYHMGLLALVYFDQAQMGRIQHAQNCTQKVLNYTWLVFYTSACDLCL